MPSINPYLNFQGNTEEAFQFYQSIFGGEFIGGISRFKDTPESDKLPENERNKVGSSEANTLDRIFSKIVQQDFV